MENLKNKYFGFIIGVNTVESSLFMGAGRFMDFVGQRFPNLHLMCKCRKEMIRSILICVIKYISMIQNFILSNC